jgi:hypothetical protein
MPLLRKFSAMNVGYDADVWPCHIIFFLFGGVGLNPH